MRRNCIKIGREEYNTGLESQPVSASFTTSAAISPHAPVVAAAPPIHAQAGVAYSGLIAAFYPGPARTNSDYNADQWTATINWGDGHIDTAASANPVLITANPQRDTLDVTGSHTYAYAANPPAATVTLTHHTAGPSASAQVAVTITQRPAGLLNLTATSDGTGSLQLNWSAGDTTATGFRIESSSDADVTFQTVTTVGSSANSYTITGLPADSAQLSVRVVPFNTAGDGDASVAGALSPSQSTNWYKAYFDAAAAPTVSPFIPVGLTTFNSTGTVPTSLDLTAAAQTNGAWVHAASPDAAIQQALEGSVVVGDGAGTNYVYGSSTAFQTVDDLNIAGRDIGAAVVFHNPEDLDPYQVDAYVPVATLSQSVVVQALADQTPDSNGSVQVGTLISADGNATSDQFTATVSWSNGSTSTGTLIAATVGSGFNVFATRPSGVSTTLFTLAVIHNRTGISASASGDGVTPSTSSPTINSVSLVTPGIPATPGGTSSNYAYNLLLYSRNGAYTVSRQLVNSKTGAATSLVAEQTGVFASGAADSAITSQGTASTGGYDTMRYYITDASGRRSAPKLVKGNLHPMAALDAGKVEGGQIFQTTARINPGGSGETVTWFLDQDWHYEAATAFRVIRTDLLNPSAPPVDLSSLYRRVAANPPPGHVYFGTNSYKYTINDTGNGDYANSVYSYDIQVYMTNPANSGFAWSSVAISEVHVVAPQVFMIMGAFNQDTTSYAPIINSAGAQLHAFKWNPMYNASLNTDANTYSNTVNPLIAAVKNFKTAFPTASIVLSGVSFGGGELVRALNGELLPDGTPSVLNADYVALFNPVAPLNDRATGPVDPLHQSWTSDAGVNAYNTDLYNASPGTAATQHTSNSSTRPDANDPYSTFSLPSANVKAFNDWYAPFGVNWGNSQGFLEGGVVGASATQSIAAIQTPSDNKHPMDMSLGVFNASTAAPYFPSTIGSATILPIGQVFSSKVASLNWSY